jgi:hypothetical protein
MEKTRKPSSHALSGVTAPPIEPEAAEEYRKKWGMYPPKAHTLLVPPEYRLKPRDNASAAVSHVASNHEVEAKPLGDVGKP